MSSGMSATGVCVLILWLVYCPPASKGRRPARRPVIVTTGGWTTHQRQPTIGGARMEGYPPARAPAEAHTARAPAEAHTARRSPALSAARRRRRPSIISEKRYPLVTDTVETNNH